MSTSGIMYLTSYPSSSSHKSFFYPYTCPPLKRNQLRLSLTTFALSKNNVTYSCLPTFTALFPTPTSHSETHTRLPVWGHAIVQHSTHPYIKAGWRYFGYFPLGTHHTLTVSTCEGEEGKVVTAAAREGTMPMYTRYYRIDEGNEEEDKAFVLNFVGIATGVVLARSLVSTHPAKSTSFLITSASSKVGLATAWALRQREGVEKVWGVSSSSDGCSVANQCGLYDGVGGFVELGLGLGLSWVSGDGDVVCVDITGSAEKVTSVRKALGERWKGTWLVGAAEARTIESSDKGKEGAMVKRYSNGDDSEKWYTDMGGLEQAWSVLRECEREFRGGLKKGGGLGEVGVKKGVDEVEKKWEILMGQGGREDVVFCL